MRKFRNPLWLLVVTCLVAITGTIVMFLQLRPTTVESLQAAVLTAERAPNGLAKVLVTGQWQQFGQQAMLIPEQGRSSLDDAELVLSAAVTQIATDGRLAVVVTRDHRLLTLDVTPGRSSVVEGNVKLFPEPNYPINSRVYSIAMTHSKVVVSRGNFDLTLVEIADRALPRQIDQLATSSYYADMESCGGLIYAVSPEMGLAVVSVAGDRLQQHFVPGSPQGWRLAVSGNYLVVASRRGELVLYDLDQQGRPHPAGTMKLAQDIRDLSLSREALYVCTAAGQLFEFSLRKWPQPVLSGQLDLNGRPLRLEWIEETRQLSCSLVAAGLAIIDASRPGAPRSAGMLFAPPPFLVQKAEKGRYFLGGNDGLRIASSNLVRTRVPLPEYFYPDEKSTGRLQLVSWNGSVFTHGRDGLSLLADSLEPVGGTTGTETRNKVPLLALAEEAGVCLHAIHGGKPDLKPLASLPVSDPDVMTDRDKYIDLIRGSFWQSGHLFVLTPYRVKIFSCDSVGVATLVGEYRFSGKAVAMDWLKPGYVVVGLQQIGVQVLDVRNPSAPRLIGEYPIPRHLKSIGSIGDVLIDGHHLYVSRGRLGVEIYDLSDPAAPKLTQRITTSGYAAKLSLDDGVLTVSDQGKGVFVIDVGGEFGQPIGSYPLPTNASEILNYRGRLFVVNASGGVLDLPAPRRLDPKRVSARELAIPIGADIPAGRYALAVYEDGQLASLPLDLP